MHFQNTVLVIIGHLFLPLCNMDSILLVELKYYHENSNKGKISKGFRDEN